MAHLKVPWTAYLKGYWKGHWKVHLRVQLSVVQKVDPLVGLMVER
jgi:hypothetical protein